MNDDQQQRISEALENLVQAIDDPEARVMVVAEVPHDDHQSDMGGGVMGEIVTANFDCQICMVNMLAAAIVQINDSQHEESPAGHLH